MAQTIEELAELLEGVKEEAGNNSEKFEKLLVSLNNKIELMSEDMNIEDVAKVYLNELKQILQERYNFVTEQFENINISIKSLNEMSNDLAKSSDVENLLKTFTQNIENLSTELNQQKESFSDYENHFNSYISDKTDKEELLQTISNIKIDVDNTNQGLIASLSGINNDIQTIIQNLIVMDPSAQNDIVKRQLENIYLSTNTILTEIQHIGQQHEDLMTSINSVYSVKEDLLGLSNDVQKYSELLQDLKDSIDIKNSEMSEIIKNNLDELNKTLSAVVTEQDFARFRDALGGLVQKIIDNSNTLNTNFNSNKETLDKIMTNIEHLDVHQDMQLITESLEQTQNITTTGVNHITTEINLLKESISENLTEMNLTEKILALKNIIAENVQSRDEKFLALNEKLEEYIVRLNEISNNTDAKIGSSINEINVLKEEVAAIAKELQNINYNQEDRDLKIIGKVTFELDELGNTISTLQDSVQTGVHQELQHNSELVENQINKLTKIIEEFTDSVKRIEEEKTSKDEENTYKVVETTNKIAETISEAKDAITEAVANATAELSAFTSAQENTQTQNAEIKFPENPTIDIETPLKDVKDRITAIKQEINLVNTDILDTLNAKTEAMISELTPLKDSVEKIFEALSYTDKNNGTDIYSDDIEYKEYSDSLSESIMSYIEEIKNTIEYNFYEMRSNEFQRISDKTEELLAESREISSSGNKISHLLDILNEKIDVLVDDSDDIILDEIDEVKNIISSQRTLLEKANNEDKIVEIQENLEGLVQKIDTIETTDLKDMRESILTAILSVFEQISFIEESEDIKDFVEEKTDEINQNLIEVKQQLKQLTNNENDNYTYTLQDIETDIAKLRLVLNDISNTSSNEEISDISRNIHKIVSSVEEMQTSLTQEQMTDLKNNFEKLSEDVVSISSRTNKLLLSSDESYQSLHSSLNDFSNVIYKLEDRINYLDNQEITERIEQKLDNTLTIATENANSNKVMRQALAYMGEWIDGTDERIEKMDEVHDILLTLQDKIPEHSETLNILSEKFDEQQERMDRLELKLERILTAIEDIDDSKLQKKIDKIDKQITKLGSNIEKLTSYVDE